MGHLPKNANAKQHERRLLMLMRKLLPICLLAVAAAQSPVPVKIGRDIYPPRLIHQEAIEVTREAKQNRVAADFLVDFIIDEYGVPQDVRLNKRHGYGSDEKVVEAVKKFRFQPALKDGKTPVPTRMAMQLPFPSDTFGSYGDRANWTYFEIKRADTDAYLRDETLIKTVTPQYTKRARKAKLQGPCTLAFTLDEKGVAHDIRVIHALDPELDQQALDALQQFQFQPILENGSPVAVPITLEFQFRLF
jgi:TonB family protein